jgi:hypothetical protein
MKREKRTTNDRRQTPTPAPYFSYTFGGKRMNSRRREEDKNYFVDRYRTLYLLIIMGIVFFCLLDAFLTLGLIRRGGLEFNPLMDHLIQKNVVLFLVVKTSITSFCIIFLLVHKNFHVFRGLKIAYLIYTVLSLYLILIIYELYLYISNRFL